MSTGLRFYYHLLTGSFYFFRQLSGTYGKIKDKKGEKVKKL